MVYRFKYNFIQKGKRMKMKEIINFYCYYLYINKFYYSNKVEVEIFFFLNLLDYI